MSTGTVVMVVDDDEALRESVSELLEDDGYRAICADSGTNALDRLRAERRKPDLILLDLMMPGMNGWQFRDQQLRDPALASIPVVVMTATRDLEDINADEVVYKPLKLAKLLDVVERHTGKRNGSGPPSGGGSLAEARLEDGSVGVPASGNGVNGQVHARRRVEPGDETFRRLVSQLDAGIAQTDLSGRFTFTNERYREIVGRSSAELLQLTIQDITHPDDLSRSVTRFQKLIEHGVPFVIEKRYVRPDGSIVWVQNNVARIDDEAGRPLGTAAVAVDITKRRFAEQALRESEERFRRMADNASASEARFRAIFEGAEVSLWDEDLSKLKALVDDLKRMHGSSLRSFLEANPEIVAQGVNAVRIRDVNPATLRLLGARTKKELLGSLLGVFMPDTNRVFLEEMIAIAEGQRTFVAETPLQTLGGQRIDVLMTLSLPLDDKSYEHVLVTLVDISTRKVAESEREARLAEVEQALHFSETFVGILGHDLRNPLSAIVTASELILRRETNERVARPIQRIHNSAGRMTRMIEQILDFTRARIGGGIPIEPVAMDLRALATDLVEEVGGAAPQQIMLAAEGDMRGDWDRDRLAQVLSNLLGNAIEHGDPGQPVQLELDGTEPSHIRVSLWNAGVIPETQLPRLFDPFRRATETSHGPQSRGLGLGLYIVQQVVEAHGGSIDVRSSADAGTTFFLSIPRSAHARRRVSARSGRTS